MAQGDRIGIGQLQAGTLHLQEGAGFTETAEGWDSGMRQWITSPLTDREGLTYPKIGDRDAGYPYMQIFQLDESLDESGLRIVSAAYRGVKNTNSGNARKSHFLRPDVATQMVNLPALSGGQATPGTLIVPVPVPVLSRSFLTTNPVFKIDPFDGVGNPAPAVDWLPPPGAWSISYIPDPDQPLAVNYYRGWVLMNRTVEPSCSGSRVYSWLVQEVYHWFWGFSA